MSQPLQVALHCLMNESHSSMGLAEEWLLQKGNTCLDLKIIHSCSGLWDSSPHWATITQQRRMRWLCAVMETQPSASGVTSPWTWEEPTLWPLWLSPEVLTISQSCEEQVLSLLKQAASQSAVLSSYSCTLGKETGKMELHPCPSSPAAPGWLRWDHISLSSWRRAWPEHWLKQEILIYLQKSLWGDFTISFWMFFFPLLVKQLSRQISSQVPAHLLQTKRSWQSVLCCGGQITTAQSNKRARCMKLFSDSTGIAEGDTTTADWRTQSYALTTGMRLESDFPAGVSAASCRVLKLWWVRSGMRFDMEQGNRHSRTRSAPVSNPSLSLCPSNCL